VDPAKRVQKNIELSGIVADNNQVGIDVVFVKSSSLNKVDDILTRHTSHHGRGTGQIFSKTSTGF
jgi:hypothetical protein